MDPQVHKELLDAVNKYKLPSTAINLLKEHPPLIIAGVTAAGKDTVAETIIKESNWRRVISHTNRSLRPGERSGENYWFVRDGEMLELVKNQAFMDIKVVHQIMIYGTTITAYQEIIENDFKPLWVLDVQGVNGILRSLPPNIRPIFIIPPDFDTWMERIEKQSPASYAERTRRLSSAKTELKEVINNERYLLLVNREVPVVAREIIKGVSDAQTQRHNREIARQLLSSINYH